MTKNYKPGGITYIANTSMIAQQRQPKSLPSTDAGRKSIPIVTGCLDYFPDALLDVATCSKIANDQHNPGEPLHWSKDKSTDEVNTLVRHLMQRGTRDTDGIRHSAKIAWRALANLQREIEHDLAEQAATSAAKARRAKRHGARRG